MHVHKQFEANHFYTKIKCINSFLKLLTFVQVTVTLIKLSCVFENIQYLDD